MNPFLRYLADKNSAHTHTDRQTDTRRWPQDLTAYGAQVKTCRFLQTSCMKHAQRWRCCGRRSYSARDVGLSMACRTADTHTSLGGAPGTRPPTHHQDHPRLPSHGLSILLLASATAVKTPLLLLLLRQQSPLLNWRTGSMVSFADFTDMVTRQPW